MKYIEYTTRNLYEYNKLMTIIESTKNQEQFDIVKTMVDLFIHNCIFRRNKLKRIAWLKMLQLSNNGWKKYISYEQSSTIQIESLMMICELWINQYSEWVQAQETEDKEIQKKKIPIEGFSKLFKSKKHKSK